MKLKIVLILMVVLSTISCQNYNEKDFVRDFINDLILKENFNSEVIDKYLNFKEEVKSEKDYIANIQELSQVIKEGMGDASANFDILTYEEAFDLNIESIHSYKKGYEKYDGTYFIVDNGKIITPPIIVEEGRIISYVTQLQKKPKQDIFPIILN